MVGLHHCDSLLNSRDGDADLVCHCLNSLNPSLATPFIYRLHACYFQKMRDLSERPSFGMSVALYMFKDSFYEK